MLRIDTALPLKYTQNDIFSAVFSKLPVTRDDIIDCELLKLTLDLSDKTNIRYKAAIGISLSAELEEKLKLRKKVAKEVPSLEFVYEKYDTKNLSPVIIGAGPCGLFAALILAEAGANPIIIERGAPVEERNKVVEAFLKHGILNNECNVQFGEGGAGTYSDGKLKSGSLNKYKYKILKEFIEAGATPDIIYSSSAHLGTNKLTTIVKNLRQKILDNGGTFIYNAKFTELIYQNDILTSIKYIKNGSTNILPCTDVILAIGHSARDTIVSLYEQGFQIIPKGFGIGMRIEHPREYINDLIYGKNHSKDLETASYHLVTHLKNGRGVYSFCMCPGGTVVPAASEEGGIVTNGMSSFARDADNSNSALLVSVTPEDYMSDHPLAGLELQRTIERRAFSLASSNYSAPTIKMSELRDKKSPDGIYNSVKPSYSIGTLPLSPSEYLPGYIIESLATSFTDFDDWVPGFYFPDAVLTGPETRTTSPIKMLRNEETRLALAHPHVYPSGEGAGYAGGIVTSAYDGVLSALALLEKFKC